MATTGVRGAILASALLAACGGGEPPTYSIGGTVSGLVGRGLVLASPGLPDLVLEPGQTTFTFGKEVEAGTSYEVIVEVPASEPAQDCEVQSGSGVVSAADVTGISVSCLEPERSFTRFAEGPRGVLLLGGHCTGTAFLGRRVVGAPVYVLTAGHCFAVTGNDDVFVDAELSSTAYLNHFADAPASAQLSIPLSRALYATMWGHDLAILRLEASQESLTALGIPLPTLAAAVPDGGPVFTYGYRVWEPLMRRTDCTLGPRVWLLESTWSWMSARRLECPIPDYIQDGSSGSPVFAGDTSEIFGILNTGSENPDGPPCVLDQPCEVHSTGPVNVRDARYLQDATRLVGCFDDGGVLDLALPGCGLPDSTFSLQPTGSDGELAVAPNRSVASGSYRWAVNALAGFDPTSADGYGVSTDASSFTYQPPAPPYVVTALAEPDFDPGGIEPLALHLRVVWP